MPPATDIAKSSTTRRAHLFDLVRAVNPIAATRARPVKQATVVGRALEHG